MNVSILHLNDDYNAHVKSCGAVKDRNCCLTMPGVWGLRTCDLLLQAINIDVFECCKNNSNKIRHVALNLQTLKVIMLILQGAMVSYWNSAWDCHALVVVSHEIIWCQALVTHLSLLLWKNWCHFTLKCLQSCYDTHLITHEVTFLLACLRYLV